jgi:hypothetical protein
LDWLGGRGRQAVVKVQIRIKHELRIPASGVFHSSSPEWFGQGETARNLLGRADGIGRVEIARGISTYFGHRCAV